MGVDEIDLSDIGFWTAPVAQRAEAFATLRAQRPIAFFLEPMLAYVEPGPGFYALTRLDDVVAASRRPEIFTSGQGASNIADMPEQFREFFGSIINMDDPRHARLRRIVSRGFTPRRLATLQGDVERAAARIVDEVIDRGACDVVTEISAALPLQIVCDLMGIPPSQHGYVFDRSNMILGPLDPEYIPPGTDVLAALYQAGTELAALMTDLAAVRTAHPTDDVTSALVNAEVDGERLTPAELASFFILLVLAGNETTRNAISWGVTLLSEHPAQRAALAADFDALAPAAVEEIVRWSSPVIYMRRTLNQPAELGGHQFAGGEKVALFYWAANRDPAHFADPDAFDITRSPNPHVGFGGPGPHFCLGAHLARREITVMFRELLARLPDLHVTGEPQRLKSMFINGIKHLPCVFTPGGSS